MSDNPLSSLKRNILLSDQMMPISFVHLEMWHDPQNNDVLEAIIRIKIYLSLNITSIIKYFWISENESVWNKEIK